MYVDMIYCIPEMMLRSAYWELTAVRFGDRTNQGDTKKLLVQ